MANDYSAQIALGGITFNTYAADTTTANQRWFADLVGWDAAPRRPVTLARLTDDGEDGVAGYLGPRPITVTGYCAVTSTTPVADLKVARERLMRAMLIVPSALATLTVTDPIPTTAAVYAVAAPPLWEMLRCQGGAALARFSFGLIAPDPRKYVLGVTTTALAAGIAMPAPTASSSATGGSLTGSTFSYRVSAINGTGETAPSAPVVVSFPPLSSPAAPTVTAGFSGTLPSGTYAYRITAVNASGETLASPVTTYSFGGSGGSVFSLTIGWSPVAGATGYNVYGRTAGSQLKINTSPVTGTSYVDTGALTPAGAVPGSNTTGTTTGSVTLNWAAVAGATGYNVYGRSQGGELKMTPSAITALTFTDTGSVTPSGALPTGGFATTVTNSGDYATRPVLTVSGATSPVTLSISGRAVVVNGVVSGDTLVVDTGLKTVTLNGLSRYDLLDNTSQWPALAPGANAVVYTGGGSASLAHYAAYG